MEKRLLAFETRCYRRILALKWQDRITSEEIRAVVQRKETVVDTIRMRKLQLFGHICRMPDDRLLDINVWNGRGWASSGTTCTKIDWWHFEVVYVGKIWYMRDQWPKTVTNGDNPWLASMVHADHGTRSKKKKKSPNEWRHQFTRNTFSQYCMKKRLIFVISFSFSVRR